MGFVLESCSHRFKNRIFNFPISKLLFHQSFHLCELHHYIPICSSQTIPTQDTSSSFSLPTSTSNPADSPVTSTFEIFSESNHFTQSPSPRVANFFCKGQIWSLGRSLMTPSQFKLLSFFILLICIPLKAISLILTLLPFGPFSQQLE